MGREVTVELLKYPGRPSRAASTVVLGDDEYGVWLGHVERRVVYLVPHRGWWKARHFPDGGWKVDIATPPVWHDDRVVLEDLALDVRRMHGRVWVEDEDEFEDFVAAGVYPPEVAAAARQTCESVRAAMYEEPFRSVGDKWLALLPSRWDAALLIDMGGVLSRHASDAGTQQWETRLGLDDGGLARVLRAAIGPGWEGGRSSEEIDGIACDALGIDEATLLQLRIDLMRDAPLDDQFLRLISSRPRRTAAAVLSNNGSDVRRVWDAAYDINSVVDLVVVSGEERVAKPDRLLYQIAASRLGVEAARCIFVDDDDANVAAARAAGMVAIRHTHDEPAHAAVQTALGSL